MNINYSKYNFKIFLSTLLLISGLLLGCGEKEVSQKTTPKLPPPPAVLPTPVEEEEKEIPVYVYQGDRFRDPFLPVGTVSSYQPDALFDPIRAKVKAIIYGPDSRSALLVVGGSGSYFVKGRRIFDVMGKTIDGYKSKVLVDRVIISGEADEVYELRIRETEEDQS